jgi:hypothetical protein
MTNGFDIRIEGDAPTAQRLVLEALEREGFDLERVAADTVAARRSAEAASSDGWAGEQFAPISFEVFFTEHDDRVVAQLRHPALTATRAGSTLPAANAFDEAAIAIADALMQAGTYAGSDVL